MPPMLTAGTATANEFMTRAPVASIFRTHGTMFSTKQPAKADSPNVKKLWTLENGVLYRPPFVTKGIESELIQTEESYIERAKNLR